jgi:hypothetical protein
MDSGGGIEESGLLPWSGTWAWLSSGSVLSAGGAGALVDGAAAPVVVVVAFSERPGKAWDATAENTPVSPMAPAITQRLACVTRRSAASRASLFPDGDMDALCSGPGKLA